MACLRAERRPHLARRLYPKPQASPCNFYVAALGCDLGQGPGGDGTEARFVFTSCLAATVFLSVPIGTIDHEREIDSINIGFRPTVERASTSVDFWLAHDRSAMNIAERARHRWHEAVRRIIQQQRQKAGRRVTPSRCSKFAHLSMSLSEQALVRKLRAMAVTRDYHIDEMHGALVRSMQFSPDGQHLVTSRYV